MSSLSISPNIWKYFQMKLSGWEKEFFRSLKGFVGEDLRNCGFVPTPAPSTHHFHSIHLSIHLIYSFSKQVDKAAKMTTSGDMYPQWTSDQKIVFMTKEEAKNLEYKYLIVHQEVSKSIPATFFNNFHFFWYSMDIINGKNRRIAKLTFQPFSDHNNSRTS